MSDVHDYPRCSRCGHQPGYHGATFCNIMAGTPPGRPCDCPGWHVGSENEAAAGYGAQGHNENCPQLWEGYGRASAQVAALRRGLELARACLDRAVPGHYIGERAEIDRILLDTASAAAGYGLVEPLRAALLDRSREIHYVVVRNLDSPACSGEWEDCPQPICARDRALLKEPDTGAPTE